MGWNSSLIHGIGTGHFNELSIQIPIIIRHSMNVQQVEVIGEGKGIWDHVHVEDLGMLYEILVVKIPAEEELVAERMESTSPRAVSIRGRAWLRA